MYFDYKGESSKIALSSAAKQNSLSAPAVSQPENNDNKKDAITKKTKIAFCSTAAILASLGIFVASKGKKGVSNLKTVVNQPSNVNLKQNNVVNYADDFINNFLKGKDGDIEKVFLNHDFAQYGKSGIPLKYPRNQFFNDVNQELMNLPKQRQDDVLKQFNLVKGHGDIDGIPNLLGQIDSSTEAQNVKKIIEKFLLQNESTVSDPSAKKAFDCIIKGFPEFNMTIGKVQHGTHAYSVDIHSLNVLQKALKHNNYANLSDEGKEVLKLTTLVHDFGKKGNVITNGHAAKSKDEALLFIDNYNLSKSV